jgi:hypothetical protein
MQAVAVKCDVPKKVFRIAGTRPEDVRLLAVKDVGALPPEIIWQDKSLVLLPFGCDLPHSSGVMAVANGTLVLSTSPTWDFVRFEQRSLQGFFVYRDTVPTGCLDVRSILVKSQKEFVLVAGTSVHMLCVSQDSSFREEVKLIGHTRHFAEPSNFKRQPIVAAALFADGVLTGGNEGELVWWCREKYQHLTWAHKSQPIIGIQVLGPSRVATVSNFRIVVWEIDENWTFRIVAKWSHANLVWSAATKAGTLVTLDKDGGLVAWGPNGEWVWGETSVRNCGKLSQGAIVFIKDETLFSLSENMVRTSG